MENEIAVTGTNALATGLTLAEAARLADHHALHSAFSRDLAEMSANTRSAYQNDLATWAAYLDAVGVDHAGHDWFADPGAWASVSHGLVDGFKQWLLREGMAVGTINRKLACVRKFCAMAHRAGIIDASAQAMIQATKLIKASAGVELDKQRSQTRTGTKKARGTRIGIDQAQKLKQQPDTPQGRRDALLMCLLLDHGLRAGEIAALTVDEFDLGAETFTFYREKVKKIQTHRLTPDTLAALRRYIESGDVPALGPLIRSSLKNDSLGHAGMTRESVSRRVTALGKQVELAKLSAHDCRHYWTTRATRAGTDPFALKQAGGWSSMTTVSRYVDESTIANEGVKLG